MEHSCTAVVDWRRDGAVFLDRRDSGGHVWRYREGVHHRAHAACYLADSVRTVIAVDGPAAHA
jgi:hypothetical protein